MSLDLYGRGSSSGSKKKKDAVSSIPQGSLFDLKSLVSEGKSRFEHEGRGAVKGGKKAKELPKDSVARSNPGVVARMAMQSKQEKNKKHENLGGLSEVERIANMERKAAKYAAAARGDVSALTDKQWAEGTVDFHRKGQEGEFLSDSDDEDESAAVPKATGYDPDDYDEITRVTYVDELGRTRTGTKREAKEAETARRRGEGTSASHAGAEARLEEGLETEVGEAHAEVLQSNVIYGAQAFFPVYEQTAEEIRRRAKAANDSVAADHYDSTKEVRAKAAGAYQFSQDEETRRAQQEALKEMRNTTEAARERATQRTELTPAQQRQKRKAEERLQMIEAKRIKAMGPEELQRRRDEAAVKEAERVLEDIQKDIDKTGPSWTGVVLVAQSPAPSHPSLDVIQRLASATLLFRGAMAIGANDLGSRLSTARKSQRFGQESSLIKSHFAKQKKASKIFPMNAQETRLGAPRFFEDEIDGVMAIGGIGRMDEAGRVLKEPTALKRALSASEMEPSRETGGDRQIKKAKMNTLTAARIFDEMISPEETFESDKLLVLDQSNLAGLPNRRNRLSIILDGKAHSLNAQELDESTSIPITHRRHPNTPFPRGQEGNSGEEPETTSSKNEGSGWSATFSIDSSEDESSSDEEEEDHHHEEDLRSRSETEQGHGVKVFNSAMGFDSSGCHRRSEKAAKRLVTDEQTSSGTTILLQDSLQLGLSTDIGSSWTRRIDEFGAAFDDGMRSSGLSPPRRPNRSTEHRAVGHPADQFRHVAGPRNGSRSPATATLASRFRCPISPTVKLNFDLDFLPKKCDESSRVQWDSVGEEFANGLDHDLGWKDKEMEGNAMQASPKHGSPTDLAFSNNPGGRADGDTQMVERSKVKDVEDDENGPSFFIGLDEDEDESNE